MKILLTYYSRSGTTKKIAEEIQGILNCDMEEIISKKKRGGIMGFMISGKEGSQGTPAAIKPLAKSSEDYDLVIVGTPVWAGNVSSPVRQYLMDNVGKIRKVAFFCTMGGEDSTKVFSEMEKVCQIKPIATVGISVKEIAKKSYLEKEKDFIEKISN